MKLECQIQKIKSAILKVEKITGKNLTLPVLDSILFIASKNSLKLRATNLSLGVEVEIPSKITKEGSVLIKGDVLSNIFTNLYQNELVSLENINNNLLIKTKENTIFLKTQPFEDFPTIPNITGQSFKINTKKFIDGIKSVYYSSSFSDIKPEISSIFIYPENDNLIFVATDSFRLAEKKIKTKELHEFNGILIPFKNISEIMKIFNDLDEELNITLSKNIIALSAKDIYLTSRIIDGNFPDYKQIMPKTSTTEVVVLKQDLLNSLKISNIFSDSTNQITFKIKTKEKSFEINSQNSDIGENKTKIEAAISGEDVEIGFNYKYFLDCFQSLAQDSVSLQFNQTNKPLTIKGVGDNSFTYLIMPMNK
jgi:DNA polymerase-3 subunit beta